MESWRLVLMKKFYTQSTLRWLSLTLCSLGLLFLLTACDLFGGGSASATPTPKPAPATTLTTYTGDGYSIGYPQGWTAKKVGNLVTFSDALGINELVIEFIPDPNSLAPSSTLINTSLAAFQSQAKNYQKVSAASTVTLAGVSWDQGVATGDVTLNGQAGNAKIVTLATNHPDHTLSTRTYDIAYSTASQLFDLSNTTYFQPMLQSFKFV